MCSSDLAGHTQNNISYKDLMVAAGHIIEQSNLIIIDEAHSSENTAVNEQIETYSPMDLREKRMELERKFFQVILSNLYTASFKWGINNSEERTHFPDMTIDIDHDGYTKWYLEFKGSLDERRGLAFHPYHIFGQISMMDFKPTDKFTLATNSEIDFNRVLRRPPKSLRANLYIMLIDLNRGIIIREEKICDYKD